ncbi:putative trancriptional regulator, ArsR family [Halalkaliarchaeum sp. AArc-CO]|uniref:DUF7344 domain-containing protein n=1 Tax=Halalkaliarchaeum sp. AArc-CO TaxID=2866381 RepID=UPI00217CF61D|nr:hypothetical protein [Halalkaliarchaeum sp. AArc-CO]UWG50084.1 putative trancriptional regulator, ArsR family [Halalkaliarchaeum sp. AArc-CO]
MGVASATGRGGTGHVSENELFEVLANRRRRYALHALKRDAEGADEQVDLGTLAEQVAAWENEVDLGEVSYDERKRVYTALQQSHLPKMDEAGIVSFNKDRGVVEPTPAMEDVEIYMDVIHGNEIPWSEYYLGLSLVSAALYAAVWLGVYPFTLLPDLSWGVFIVVAFLVSALAHRYYTSEMRLGAGDVPPEMERESS